MKLGTHNLGRNNYGHLVLARVTAAEVELQVSGNIIRLSPDQARLLKDVVE